MPRFREQSKHSGYLFRVYRTKDDRWLQFNMVRNEELLSKLFLALDAAHVLLDDRFATPRAMYENRTILGDMIQEIVEQKTAKSWMPRFEEYDVPINLIGIVEELPNDPQVLENRMASVPDGDDTEMPLLVNHPIQISDVPHAPYRSGPKLGEHTVDILKELNYTEQQIQHLITTGSVVQDS